VFIEVNGRDDAVLVVVGLEFGANVSGEQQTPAHLMT
jgi:hypothetical protein